MARRLPRNTPTHAVSAGTEDAPPLVRWLHIPCPDPLTIQVCDVFARIHRLDRTLAAERLLFYGARSWAHMSRTSRERNASLTPEERRARAMKANAARHAKHRAAPAADAAQVAPSPTPEAGGNRARAERLKRALGAKSEN